MAGWTVENAFFLVAFAVQSVLGIVILVRRPRVEWAVVLAALFLFNGALSLNSLLVGLGLYGGGGPNQLEGPGSLIFIVFDRATTLLVGYLALAYPRRPRWAAHRPWLLPSLFAALLASAVIPIHLGVAEALFFASEVVPGCGLPCFVLTPLGIWVRLVLSLAVPLLLVRWARLLPATASPADLQQFKLLFAAFAARAVHVELLFGLNSAARLDGSFDALTSWPNPGLLFARAAAAGAAIAAAAFHLLRGRAARSSETRRATDLALAFLLVGALEVAFSRLLELATVETTYIYNPALQLDLYILRPALVAYAMVRHDLFGPLRPARWAVAAAVAGLAALALLAALSAAMRTSRGALVVTAGGALALTLAASALLRPHLGRPRAQAGDDPGEAVPAYLAALEDAYRNGEPSRAQRAGLAARRNTLGLSRAEAGALEAAVRTRWAGSVGAPSWRAGETLAGRYRIERFLGEGSCGSAHLAQDLLASRTVVLKRTHRLDAAGRKALLREAHALSRLDHPNVVRLLRTEMAGDEPVLVLEHLAGGSLAGRLARGPLRPQEARRLALDVLAGLGAAHAAGLVHRDVKPSNILFGPDGRAKVADFGIAVRTDASPLVAHTATVLRAPGSLRYMSPEQVRGLPATPATDLYAVGAVLAEATGGLPFAAEASSDYDVRRRIVEGPGPRLAAGLPRRLAAAIRAATRKDPRERVPSAKAMAALLGG